MRKVCIIGPYAGNIDEINGQTSKVRTVTDELAARFREDIEKLSVFRSAFHIVYWCFIKVLRIK